MIALLLAASLTATYVEGPATVQSRPLHQGEAVLKGDTVETAAGARVEITFPNGTILRLGESSKITVSGDDPGGAGIDDRVGTTIVGCDLSGQSRAGWSTSAAIAFMLSSGAMRACNRSHADRRTVSGSGTGTPSSCSRCSSRRRCPPSASAMRRRSSARFGSRSRCAISSYTAPASISPRHASSSRDAASLPSVPGTVRS